MDGLPQTLPVPSARLPLAGLPGDPRGSRREPAVIVVPPPFIHERPVRGGAPAYALRPAGPTGLLVDVYG